MHIFLQNYCVGFVQKIYRFDSATQTVVTLEEPVNQLEYVSDFSTIFEKNWHKILENANRVRGFW